MRRLWLRRAWIGELDEVEARHVRKLWLSCAMHPLVMSDAIQDAARLVKKAGMTGVLTKPVSPAGLRLVVQTHTSWGCER